ncbi:RICIN domain-containing protein, partial [Kitasatospora indigofera]|uniref:RICIN domain-containing protein n=1 Tax=Kitasatospora indigofera TaxID=67307 RepID=UPI0033A65AFD
MFETSDPAPSEVRPRAAFVHRRPLVLTAALLPAVSAALFAVPAPAGAAALPTAGTYQLAVAKSGKCIDVPAASTANGALLQQWGCTA